MEMEDSLVLEEDLDPNYEPTQEEVRVSSPFLYIAFSFRLKTMLSGLGWISKEINICSGLLERL